MKKCLFCDSLAGSAEHVFAQWLIDRMDADSEPFIVAHRTLKETQSRKPHGLRAFTTRSVCEKCNNGWMSALESQFQRVAGILVEKQWPKLATTLLFSAASEGEILGKWALKTLVCIGHAGIKSNVVKPRIAHDLYNGNLPSDFHVRLGHLREPAVGALVTKGLPVQNGGRPIEWQEHSDGEAFKAVFALNHLALGIVRAPSAKIAYVAPEASLPVIAHPQGEKRERERYSFSNVDVFDKSIVVETGMAVSLPTPLVKTELGG